jgi:hypothetical protein
MRFGIPSLAFVLASGCGADTELVRSDATADASSDDATVPPPGDDNLGDDAGLAPPVDAMPADVRVAQDGEPNGVLRSGLVLDASVTLADCPDATPIPDAQVFLCDPLPPGSVGCAASTEPDAAVNPVVCVTQLPIGQSACVFCCGPQKCYCIEDLRSSEADASAPATYSFLCLL